MSDGHKLREANRLAGLAFITKARKGQRITGPTFPPPKVLPPLPKTVRKESDDE